MRPLTVALLLTAAIASALAEEHETAEGRTLLGGGSGGYWAGSNPRGGAGAGAGWGGTWGGGGGAAGYRGHNKYGGGGYGSAGRWGSPGHRAGYQGGRAK